MCNLNLAVGFDTDGTCAVAKTALVFKEQYCSCDPSRAVMTSSVSRLS